MAKTFIPTAGNVDLGAYTPVQLFAGSSEVITDNYAVGAADLAAYQVVALDGNNKLVALNPAASDTTKVAVGITCYACAQNAAGAAIYVGGDFNVAALDWPASLTTLAARKAVFQRTKITVRALG